MKGETRYGAIPGLMIAIGLTGCVSLTSYHPVGKAPDRVKEGKPSFGVVATRLFVEPFTPILRRVSVPFGKLHNADGLEVHLRTVLKPLDIVVVRSKPSLPHLVIPGHFIHAAIWLGSVEDLRQQGVLHLREAMPHARDLKRGKTVGEADDARVRLAPINVITNTDEILVLRAGRLDGAGRREKYKRIFSLLGTPFDNNLDLNDKKRLTCVETVQAVFPELDLPVRFTAGRLALIPDDLVRIAINGKNGLSVVDYIVPDGKRSFGPGDVSLLAGIISSPKPKQRRRADC